MTQSFLDFLRQRLQHPLPGQDAQIKMAPIPVADAPERQLVAPSDASNSSVLIPLLSNAEQEMEMILTLRSKKIDHGGEISFPGGRTEEGETATEAALRETHEEIGIHPESVTVLGTLSKLYVSASNNYVTPVVGFIDHLPELHINPAEVAETFTVELDSLANKKNLTVEQWNRKEYTYHVPFWDVHRVPLWGATAMILSEFLELYREFKSQSSSSR